MAVDVRRRGELDNACSGDFGARLATPGRARNTSAALFIGGRQFLLAEGVTVIGRAGVRIESGGVSRHHARIVQFDCGHAHVEDLGSKNGTFVGGKPVTDARVLRDGDEIRVGPVALTFSVAPTTQGPRR